jgi:hypothetical protein
MRVKISINYRAQCDFLPVVGVFVSFSKYFKEGHIQKLWFQKMFSAQEGGLKMEFVNQAV